MRHIALALLFATVGAASVAAFTMWRHPVTVEDDKAAIVLPDRNALAPPPALQPPSLPARAAQIPPLSYVVTTTWSSKQGRRTTTETLTRRHDRVRMTFDSGHQEWLFVQNARYPDRVSGYLTDHRARQILLHEETLLRTTMGIRGWSDVLTMRFDPAVLSTLHGTGERRTVSGVDAARFVASTPTRAGVSEVWWSDELLLPVSLTVRDAEGTVTSVVDRLSRTTDDAVLADPDQRFPDYTSEDSVDAHDH